MHVRMHELRMFNPAFGSITSSIKPEVHNVSQRRQKRTEQRPDVYFDRYVCGQTNTQTHTHRHGRHNTPLCLDVCTYVPRCDWHTLLLLLLYRRRRHPLLPLDAFSETLCVPPTPISAYRSRYIHIYKRHFTAYEVTNLWRYRLQICLL